MLSTICSLFLCSRHTSREDEEASSSCTAATSENVEKEQDPVSMVQPAEKRIKLSNISLPVPGSSKESTQEKEVTSAPSDVVNVARTQSRLSFSSNAALTPARSEQITQQIAKMIAVDLQPLSIVEDHGFRELIQLFVPQYVMPSRGTIRKRIELFHSNMEVSLRTKIQKELAVALTTDAWTSCHNESYVAFTAHFINENWDLNSYLLEVAEMTESHTADNLSDRIERIISNWSLQNRVSAVVHDNAANIVAAMRNIDVRSITCSAHNLQLGITKGLKDVTISEIISKASAVVGHFNHSTKAAGELEKKQKQLNLPVHRLIKCVSTRWNSVFLMFERLIEQKAAIAAVINDSTVTQAKKAASLEINQHEWQNMADLVKILRPLQVATTTLCSEEEATASSVMPIVIRLIEKFLSLQASDSEIVKNFKMKTSQELESKFGLTRDIFLSPLTLASFLDPRYKTLGFLNDSNRTELLTLVLSKLNEEELDQTITNTNTTTALDFLLADEDETQMIFPDKRIEEIERYKLEICISRNDDPLNWWKINQNRFPLLARLARKYLCIPATSAPSERVFSSAGNIVTHRRSTLSSDIVNSLVFVYYNSKHS